MEDRLNDIFSNVNEWLKFAEGKNGALLVFNSASIFAIVRFLSSSCVMSVELEYSLKLISVIFGLSAILCIISFVPKIKIPWLLSSSKNKGKNNLLFYGDIAKFEPLEYLEAIYRSLNKNMGDIIPFEEYFAEQIVVNSKIALKKYILFILAVWLTLLGFLILISSIVFNLI